MRSPLFATLPTLAALLLSSPPAEAVAPDRTDPPSAPSAALSPFIEAEVRRLGHPGVAVGVVTRDGLVFAHGYGVRNRRTGGPVGPDTVFRLASITKVVSGLALLALRDDGKLSIDDPVSKFLPEVASVVEPFRAPPGMTIRNLVTHTSGLPRDFPKGSIATESSLLALLAQTRAESPPGAHTRYSNFAMGLVGPLVHRASSLPFRDFVRTRILAPLGMNDTVWERRDVDPAKLASGHSKNKETGLLEPEPSEWRMGAAEAFGGLYSSVDDLSKLVALELTANDDDGEEDRGPIRRASLRESQSPAFTAAPEPLRYGIPWVLANDPDFGPRVEHTGATDEYSASVSFFPRRGVGVIVLSNAAFGPDVEAVARRILRRAATLPLAPAR